jgi:hypothetical protein
MESLGIVIPGDEISDGNSQRHGVILVVADARRLDPFNLRECCFSTRMVGYRATTRRLKSLSTFEAILFRVAFQSLMFLAWALSDK